MNGGRFDFDDGGTYCGGWEEGKAHGHGICTGPNQKGEYAGAYHYGLEVSGVYTWPSGSTYQGQWQNGKRHGFGVENRGRWTYKGEWNGGLKGRYGLRQAIHSQANYLGTWSNGLHDGYGTETYVDGGTYKGQWQRGLRHGYGIRTSAPYSVAAKYYRSRSQMNASLTSLRSDLAAEEPSPSKKDKKDEEDEFRGGFVLRVRSEAPARRRRSLSERSLAVKRTILNNLRIKKQHSTGDIHQRVTSMTGSLKSSGSTMSCTSDEFEQNKPNLNEFDNVPPEEKVEGNVIETYKGEWKNDKRSGYGICERTDNVKFIGEWFNNRKHGYGVTYFKDGSKEEGRYKNNLLVCSTRRRGIMFVRSSKLREKIETSVEAAKRAADMAAQRVEITLSRTQTAQERAENAVQAGKRARDDADTARIGAIQFDPTFQQPGIEHLRQSRGRHGLLENHVFANHVSFESTASPPAQNSPHHRLLSGPPSSISTDPTASYAAAMPNFVPQQLYQQQQSVPSLNTQTPISHNNPMLNQSLPNNPLQQQAEFHSAYDTSTQQHLPAPNDPNLLAQQQHNLVQQQQKYVEELARIDEGAALLLQEQRASSSNVPNQVSLTAEQHHAMHLQHQQPQFSLMADPQLTQTGNSVGNRLHTSTSLTADATPTAADSSPRIRHIRNAAEGRSTTSLSDDHYDQYTINRQPNPNQLRRNRPSLTRQTEVLADAIHLNRRSTLASSRDRPGASRGKDSLFDWEHDADLGADGDRGSLPNINELAEQGIYLRREDAARLASQRRQEAQRMLEEEELLRANPLRYIFHPALRNWIGAHRGVLLLVASNICLLYILFYLLTFERNLQE